MLELYWRKNEDTSQEKVAERKKRKEVQVGERGMKYWGPSGVAVVVGASFSPGWMSFLRNK